MKQVNQVVGLEVAQEMDQSKLVFIWIPMILDLPRIVLTVVK